MLKNFIVENVAKYDWNRQAQLMKVTYTDGSEELYYGVVEYCILSGLEVPGHMSLKIKIRGSHFIPVEDYSKIYTQKKAVKEVAKEVNEGKWGYGADRIQRLKAAGYSYNEVQSEANRLLYVPYKPESKIKNVIFNDPATIVFWSDGTKTVVKCGENDIYDPEKGLAMAVAKKYLGTNKSHSNYMDEFKKWLPKDEWQPDPFEDFRDSIKKLAEIGGSLKEKEND